MSNDIEAFKLLCNNISQIRRQTVSQYSEVALLGRDCYRWRNYVIKSSPEKWNFKTKHELQILQYLSKHADMRYFPNLITHTVVNDRCFLLLEYIPTPDIFNQFLAKKLQSFKLLPSIIQVIENKGNIILSELRRINLIHRDITPSNFLFDRKSGHLILLDFGFSISQGIEMETESMDIQNLLENILQNNLGGKYRHSGMDFSHASDSYSFSEVIKELKQSSPWVRT